MHLLSFPEELLERILEEVVLYPSPSHHAQPSREAPSTSLGPSPIATPSATPKSSPSTTRHVSPQPSPPRSRPSSPPTLPSSSSSNTQGNQHVTLTQSNSSSSSLTSSTPPRVSPSSTPLDLALAPLLTCRLFARIALPLYYRVVQLKSREQAQLFLVDGLGCGGDQEGRLRGRETREKQMAGDARRFRAKWIRRLVLCGVWKEAGEVLKVLSELVSPTEPPRSIDGMVPQPVVQAKGKGKARVDESEDAAEAVPLEDSSISLSVLEITIDAPVPPPSLSILPSSERVPQDSQTPVQAPQDEDAEVFADALRTFASCWRTSDADCGSLTSDAMGHSQQQNNSLRHIVLRKPQNVYLTQPRSRVIISALASVVESADDLESVFIAFRISDDPKTVPGVGAQGSAGVHHHAFQVQYTNQHQQHSALGTPQPPSNNRQLGPITQLTSALASRPQLKTFATMLPSVWNEAVLRVSRNESLEKVVLLGLNGVPVAPPNNPYNQLPHPSPSPAQNSTQGNPGVIGARRPRLAVVLPPNPVERVYAASTRDVNGFHPTNPNPTRASAMEAYHGHGLAPGYGGGAYVPMGTGLFMNQARKHERLCDLLRCGAESALGFSHAKDQMEVPTRVDQPNCVPRGSASGTFVPAPSYGATNECLTAGFDVSPRRYSTQPTHA